MANETDNSELAQKLRDLADEIESDDDDELTEAEAMEQFVADHPSLVAVQKGGVSSDWVLAYTVIEDKPGTTNIGTMRTDAGKALARNGYVIDEIVFIEEANSFSGNLTVAVDVTRTDK